MKAFTQLPTLILSALVFSAPAIANPVAVADLEVREPIPAPVPEPEAIAEAELDKLHIHRRPHGSSNKNDTNSSNGAATLANGGTITLSGVAFLGSAMLLMA